MIKRLLLVAMAMIMVIGCLPVAFAADTITIAEPKFEGGKIKVAASVDSPDDKYTMIVIRKGGDPKIINDRYAMGEETSDADKNVVFTFKMPEKRTTLKTEENPEGYTDGEYTITIKGRNTEKASLDFYFVTDGMKSTVADMIAESSESEIYNYLKKDSTYRRVLVNLGFEFSGYDEQTNDIKTEIVKEFVKKMPDDKSKLGEVFNSTATLVILSKDSKAIIEYLEEKNYNFEGKTYSEADEVLKKWILDIYLAHGGLESLSDFEEIYEIANILYHINNARFDMVENVISKYADKLGIENSSEYKKYKALKSDDMYPTNEKLTNRFSKNPAKTVKELLSAISESMTSGQESRRSDYRDKTGGGYTIFSDGTIEDVVATEPINYGDAFSDLDSVSWAKNAINYLYDRKMISGVGDGKFNPDGLITREEFATMIVNAMDMHDASATTDFSDVEAGSWYEKHVASAQKNEIINGMDNNNFGVGKNITRQDVAVIIERCAEKMNLELEEEYEGAFDDDEFIADYAKDSVYTLTASKIINGVGDNMFAPTGNCTRAQAARLVYLLLTYGEEEISDGTVIPSDLVNKFRFLNGLGMFRGGSADMINPDAYILKGKFIQNAMRLVCGEEVPDEQLLETAKVYGIGVGDNYDYDAKMSFDEAFSILLHLSSMDIKGGILESAVQGYKNAITVGTTERGTEAVSQSSVINLLYNAAKYKGSIMTLGFQGGQENYSLANKTILEIKRDITKVVGIVTDNEMTSIVGETTVGKGEVKIDTVVALVGTSQADKYLGKRVEAYIYFGDDDNNKVIYLEETGKCKELIIPADKIDRVSTGSRTIEYELGNKTKTAKYSPVLKFIKNGRYYSGYTREDFEIVNGSMRLVDNDGDNIYDIVFVEKYTHIVVNGVIAYKSMVKNKYQTPEYFDFSNYENYSIIYNGENIDISQINQNDILTILSTDEGIDGVVTAYLTKSKISGVVTRIDSDEMEVKVGDMTYKLSDAYVKAGENNDPEYTEIKVGIAYDMYLDYFGEIIYAKKSQSADEYAYVYALKLYEDYNDNEEIFILKYFTLNSNWEKRELADKVRYNGKSVDKKIVVDELKDFEPEVFKVRLNEYGKVSGIETPTVTSDVKVFNKLTVSGQWSINTFALVDNSTSDGLLMLLDDSSRVFLVPVSGEEDEYSIGNKRRFAVDRNYTITGYGFDEYKVADVAVYSKDTRVSSGSDIMLVEKKLDAFVDDEVATILCGATAKEEDYTAVPTKPDLFKDIERGDLVALSTTETGKVENVLKLWSADKYGVKMTPKEWNSDTNEYVDSKFNVGVGFAAGFVKGIDYVGMKMLVDTGGLSNQIISGKNDAVIPVILIYDRKEKTTQRGDMDDIVVGDYVYMRFSWTRLQEVYIIR